MPQKHYRKRIVCFLLCLLIFLCLMPAVSRAAQPSGLQPEPSDTFHVPEGTTVDRLQSIFHLSSDLEITVWKPDGTVRAAGAVETGDRAVVRNRTGDIIDCIEIIAGSQPSSGDSVPASSSGITPPGSRDSSSASSGTESRSVFDGSTPVDSLPAAFGVDSSRVSVFRPDGAKRENGLVCTGDTIVLQDSGGNVSRFIAVVVLGDLTRCGQVTENGCSLLYSYLTGQASLPGDLPAAADMNRDGRVDTADLLEMKLKLRAQSESIK